MHGPIALHMSEGIKENYMNLNIIFIIKMIYWQYGISQLTSHQCPRALADCLDVISIVVTSSKYVGNFDHKSNLT